MSEPYTIYRRPIEERVVVGKRLGRHVMRDSRSAMYPFRAKTPVPIDSVSWARSIPILDQGDLGSCTGNAMTGALGIAPLYPNLPAKHPVLDESEAVILYGVATQLDGYPGTYPPNDTGSDGTSVCKAAQKAGLISGYTHATTLNDMLQALMAGPVLMGLDWYEGFDNPDISGVVAISGSVRGGHEVVARTVHTDAQLVGFDNSWGTSWGVAGSFFMSYATVTKLLAADGDVTVPIPLSVPAPIPTPVPTPTPPTPVPVVDLADLHLATATRDWAAARHVGANRKAAQAVTVWMKAKDLL